jgi:hypothetical protein
MKKSMFSKLFGRHITIVGALVLAAALGIPTTAAAQNGIRTFTVSNESSYQINHLYVSLSSYGVWGPDRLGDYVLSPNYHENVAIVPGWYDVMLVDEDGDRCVVPDVDLRAGERWTITNNVLLTCEWLSR